MSGQLVVWYGFQIKYWRKPHRQLWNQITWSSFIQSIILYYISFYKNLKIYYYSFTSQTIIIKIVVLRFWCYFLIYYKNKNFNSVKVHEWWVFVTIARYQLKINSNLVYMYLGDICYFNWNLNRLKLDWILNKTKCLNLNNIFIFCFNH